MKLVDEGLKEIFEKAEITDIIKAYGYMRNSGCYSRAESMSNALYNFDLETVNEYDLIIRREYRDSPPVLEFYKLANVPHLQDYIAFCLTHTSADGIPAMDVHEDAYELVIEIEEPNNLDTMFLLKEFKGIQMRKVEQANRHKVIDGVIHDGEVEEEMVEHGYPNDAVNEEGPVPVDVVEDGRDWDVAEADEEVMEEEWGEADGDDLPRRATGADDILNRYPELADMADMVRRQRAEREARGEETDDRTRRGEEILEQIDRIQRLLR